MPHLLPQNEQTQQPQWAAPIDSGGLGAGVKMLLLPINGALIDVANGRVWTPSGNAAANKGTNKGLAATFDRVDDFFTFTGYSDIVGNVGTFFMWCPTVGTADTNGHVFWGSNTGATVYFQVGAAGNVSIFGTSFSAGTVSWFSSTNKSLVMSSTGAAGRAYVDGVDSGVTTGTPVAFAAGSKSFRFGAWVGGNAWDFGGDCVVAGFTTRVWSVVEARAFHENPWKLFEPEQDPIYWNTAAPATGKPHHYYQMMHRRAA